MEKTKSAIERIKDLVKDGVLGPELQPEREFWHWNVLKPDELPDWLKDNASYYSEVRWYGA